MISVTPEQVDRLVRGWDYTDFCEIVGLPYPDDLSDEFWRKPVELAQAKEKFHKDFLYLFSHELWAWDRPTVEDTRVLALMRTFLAGLLLEPHLGYSKPIYKGLQKVESRSEFIKYFVWLIEGMWT